MGANLEQLKVDYKAGKVVPFIGAGLSAPFKVPTWKKLIEEITEIYAEGKPTFIKELVNADLERNDFWKAIDNLKTYSSIVDQDIQSAIVKLIRKYHIILEEDHLHNYMDLRRMNFQLHLTTNYDLLLDRYLKCDELSILLKDIDFNTQELFDTKRICYLHGHISNSGSIVISKDSYDELYNNKKYDNLLKLVTGTKKLLFMGFSFDDQFLRTLIKDHKDSYNGNHYILLNKPESQKIKELREEYGLLTIEYDASDTSHVVEIRNILNQLSDRGASTETSTSTTGVENTPPIVIGAGISDMDRNVENALFYKKLIIEDIDSELVDLCSAFYIAAEIYIRDLNKSGFSLKIIEVMLRKVLTRYKEKLVDTYKKYGDSQQFLEVVHESLKNIDFGRLAKSIKEHEISDEDENRGLIHILANDAKKGVWWGEKRINEENKEESKEKQTDSSTVN